MAFNSSSLLIKVFATASSASFVITSEVFSGSVSAFKFVGLMVIKMAAISPA
jgi:hypothetical protein